MDAYREPGKRKKIPRKLQSWFMQNADGTEKGPFDRESLIASGKALRLKPTALVRPEDETEWRPLSTLMAEDALRDDVKALAAARSYPSSSSSSREDKHAPLGSFGAGLCAGLFGGIIGFGLVMLIASGSDTKRGARWGLVIQLGLGLVVRLMAASSH